MCASGSASSFMTGVRRSGFDWANRHRDAVKGIAYMEAIVGPQYWDHWDKFNMRPALEGLRSAKGEEMVLQNNFFIEKILPRAILRPLSAEEMAEYRRPFAEPGEGRRPTLTWPRQIPIEGEPADVTAIVTAYADWLKTSNVPKLFLRAEPVESSPTARFSTWPAASQRRPRGNDLGASFRPGGFAGRDRAGHRRLDGEVGLTGLS